MFRLPIAGLGDASPTLCDLDGDGDLELVMGRQPPQMASAGDTIVSAFDATTGAWIWDGPFETHAYGSVGCVPRPEGGADVLVTGTSGDMLRLDGRSGGELWRLSTANPGVLAPAVPGGFVSTAIFDADAGIGALTLSGDRTNDVAARFVVFDADGHVQALRDTDVGVESYASPATTRDASGAIVFAFATGGETRWGYLELLRYDGANALVPLGRIDSACATGGFIASPLFVDVDGDHVREVVALDYCGDAVVASLDGTLRYVLELDDGFATANPVPADLDGDGRFDLVAVFSDFNPSTSGGAGSGTSRVHAFAGVDGRRLWMREIPGIVVASPAVLDLDGDADDDLILSSVAFESSSTPMAIANALRGISGRDATDRFVLNGVGSISTPVLDDVDGDGAADLFVFDAPFGNTKMSSFFRMRIDAAPWDPLRSYSGFRGHPRMLGAR